MVDSHSETQPSLAIEFLLPLGMFDSMVENLPVVSVSPAEQRAKKKMRPIFSECSHAQVLTNTDLYFSKGGEKPELHEYFQNNAGCLSSAKPLQKQSYGYSDLHSTSERGKIQRGSLLAQKLVG